MQVDTSVLIERIDIPSPSVALSPPFTDSGRHADLDRADLARRHLHTRCHRALGHGRRSFVTSVGHKEPPAQPTDVPSGTTHAPKQARLHSPTVRDCSISSYPSSCSRLQRITDHTAPTSNPTCTTTLASRSPQRAIARDLGTNLLIDPFPAAPRWA